MACRLIPPGIPGFRRGEVQNFTLAIAEQAEHHGISKGALRRFVCAKEADKLEGLDSEATDLATLLEMAA